MPSQCHCHVRRPLRNRAATPAEEHEQGKQREEEQQRVYRHTAYHREHQQEYSQCHKHFTPLPLRFRPSALSAMCYPTR